MTPLREEPPFPYESLLAYYRDELAGRPQLRATIQSSLQSDPRWQAHGQSLQYLDLERAAALQDAQDLRQYLAKLVGEEAAAEWAATHSEPGRGAGRGRPGVVAERPLVAVSAFCKAAAWSGGAVLVVVVEKH